MLEPMDYEGLPHFRPRKHKLLAAILLLLEEASRIGRELSKGEIVKSIFIADDRHLSLFGRPVTFDNYVAMKNGPVGDLASDMLNDHPRVPWADFGLEGPPWSTEPRGEWTYYRAGDVAADRRKLSPSDVTALREALEHVLEVGFGGISRETHGHPAWKAAWNGRDDAGRAAAMDWRAFPGVDAAHVDSLSFASLNAA